MQERVLIPIEEEEKPRLIPIEKEREIRTLVPIDEKVVKEEKISALGEFGKLMGTYGKGLAEFGGAALTGALSFGTNLVAQPAWGLYQQWKEGFKGVEKPWEFITETIEKGKPAKEFIYEAGPYIPKSEGVRKVMSEMFYPFALYDKAVNWVADSVSKDSATQESIKYAGDVALAFGLAATTSLIKSSFKAKAPPKIATLKRTILESKKVPKEVKAKIEMIPEESMKLPLEKLGAKVKKPWEMTREEFNASAARGKTSPFGTTPEKGLLALDEGRKIIESITTVERNKYPKIIEVYESANDIGTKWIGETEIFYKKANEAKALPLINRLEKLEAAIKKDPTRPNLSDIIERGKIYGYSVHDINAFLKNHKSIIQQALTEGKPVPLEVLAEYPDLLKRAPQTARPIPPGIKEKGIMEVEQLFKETEQAFKEIRKPSVRKAYQKLKRYTVDTSGNLKKELLTEFGDLGKEAVIHLDLARGSSKAAEVIIDRAIGEVYGGLKLGEITLLDNYIQSTRIQKVLEYKPKHRVPKGVGIEKHRGFIETLPEKITERGEAYFDIMQKMLDDLLDAGVIDEAGHTALSAHAPYSPFKFIQHLDPAKQYSFKGGMSVHDSGIKRLREGSNQLLEKNSRLLLAEVANRTYGRIFKNEANKAAYALAEQVPENGIFKSAKIIRTTKVGKPVFERTPAGHEVLDVMIDGRPRRMFMPTEWAKEWVLSDPMVNQAAAQIAGWFSGSKILKPMATGLNPEFAITNFPRDLAHIWLITNQYSSFLPKAMWQMGIDLIATSRDAFGRRGTYFDYINEGGGMQFLTHQGMIKGGKVGGQLGKVQDYLSYIGETSELWSRLALRRRAIKNGLSPHEATWEARNYLDFNQGGSLAKAVDTGVPYLNAAIQGTRGIFRAFAQRPAQTTWKVAQIGALSTGLYLANRFGNPEAWASLSDRDKANNFNITTPLKYTDKSGNERWLIFKIAKDQGQRFFCTIFENMMAKFIGDPIDTEQMWMSLADAAPIIPTQNLPPTVDAFIGYVFNKDLWRNEDIWRGPQVQRKEEWTDYTHPAFVKAGQATGLSPERMRYALQQFFTYGNIYTGITSEGLRLMLGQLPEEYQDRTKEEIIASMPFIRRVAELTYPYAKEEKAVKDIRIKENTRRFIQQRDIDRIAEDYYRQYNETGVHDEALWKKHVDYVEQQPEPDKERLYDRFDRFGKLYRIPDRRWWLNLIGLPPEARALAYWAKYRTATEEKKGSMDNMLLEIPGIYSERFKRKLVELESLDK